MNITKAVMILVVIMVVLLGLNGLLTICERFVNNIRDKEQTACMRGVIHGFNHAVKNLTDGQVQVNLTERDLYMIRQDCEAILKQKQ